MRNKLISSLAGAAFSFAASGLAFAADMPVKAPQAAPPPAPVYSWTGWYVGANVGYGWGRSSNNWNFSALGDTGKPGDPFCEPNGFALCVSGSNSNALNGVIGGFQFGYNWQTSNVLVGLETDFQFSGQNGNPSFSGGWVLSDGSAAPLTATDKEKLLWLGTLRGRVGLIVNQWLVYTTGGLAYGRVTNDGSATLLGQSIGAGATPTPCPGAVGGVGGLCPLGSWSTGTTKAGWTVGAGAEGPVGGNWSWKVEYLFVDLGNINTAFPTNLGAFGSTSAIVGLSAGTGTISSKFTDNIVRVGLNYQFH